MVSVSAHSVDNDAQTRCHLHTHVGFEPLELEQVRSKERADLLCVADFERFVLLC